MGFHSSARVLCRCCAPPRAWRRFLLCCLCSLLSRPRGARRTRRTEEGAAPAESLGSQGTTPAPPIPASGQRPSPPPGLGQTGTNSWLKSWHSDGTLAAVRSTPNSRSGRSALVLITPASPWPPPCRAGRDSWVCPAPHRRPLSGTRCCGHSRGLTRFGAASVSMSSGCGTPPRQRVPHQSTPDGTADGRDTDLLAEPAARKSGTSLTVPSPGGQRGPSLPLVLLIRSQF